MVGFGGGSYWQGQGAGAAASHATRAKSAGGGELAAPPKNSRGKAAANYFRPARRPAPSTTRPTDLLEHAFDPPTYPQLHKRRRPELVSLASLSSSSFEHTHPGKMNKLAFCAVMALLGKPLFCARERERPLMRRQ